MTRPLADGDRFFDTTQEAFRATCEKCEAPLELVKALNCDEDVTWFAACCGLNYLLIPQTWKLEAEPSWDMGPRD